MKTNESPFGEVIYAYTRKQAIADGVQVDATKTAQEAGIKFPVFLTRGVFETYVAVPEGVTGQDEAGRLWDVVWMLRFGIIRARPGVTAHPGSRSMSVTTTAPRALSNLSPLVARSTWTTRNRPSQSPCRTRI